MVTIRKTKENKPVIAICYDFDKTLSPDDMQAQGYIQAVYGEDVPSFWKESNKMAEDNEMDTNLAYMRKMVEEAHGRIVLTRETLEKYGSEVVLFPGVVGWFERIREYGKKHNVIIEHYIISSGLKEMIEGTPVAKAGAFEKIYASSFYFNDHDVAVWPAQVINYTSKTQFLFRIEKGVLDINDPAVNESFSPEEIRVPFRNIVYIGDSDTDIPCMKLVTTYGGHSIGVYDAQTEDKAKVYKMMRDGRIRYFAPADYTENSELDRLVKSIIDRTAANESLEALHYQCKRERIEADRKSSEEDREKAGLLMELENSPNFASTHSVIRKLRKIDDWTTEEREVLLQTAEKNSQVYSVLQDPDIREFYRGILGKIHPLTEEARKIKEIIENRKS